MSATLSINQKTNASSGDWNVPLQAPVQKKNVKTEGVNELGSPRWNEVGQTREHNRA